MHVHCVCVYDVFGLFGIMDFTEYFLGLFVLACISGLCSCLSSSCVLVFRLCCIYLDYVFKAVCFSMLCINMCFHVFVCS